MVKGSRKSKACWTCKSRKIRCDLQKPVCEQCQKSRRRCGGYEHAPVFVVYTTDAMQKRKAPKETRTAPPYDAWGSNFLSDLKAIYASGPTTKLGESSTLPLHSPSAEALRYVGWAYENYVVTESAKNIYNHMPIAKFLHSTLTLAGADPALDQAMLAIACRLCAVFYKDSALLDKSRELYGGALGLLQRNLRSLKLAFTDETVAATCLLSIYELTSMDRTDPDAWLSHVAGIAALLTARGPKKHHALMPRTALEQCRYNMMIQCITRRNASGFASKEWIEDPWEGANKGIEQQIMDEGLKLAYLLQRTDEDVELSKDMETIREFTEDCVQGFSRLRRIKVRSLPGLESDLDKEQPESIFGNKIPIQVGNRVVLRLTASGIQLALCDAAHAVLREAGESTDFDTTFRRNGVWKLSGSNSSAEIECSVPAEALELAKEIVQEAGMVFYNTNYLPEDIRMMFPLKVAAGILKRYQPSCPEYEQCNDLIKDLPKKGVARTKPHEVFVFGGSRLKNVQAVETM